MAMVVVNVQNTWKITCITT